MRRRATLLLVGSLLAVVACGNTPTAPLQQGASCELYCALAQLRCRNAQLLYPDVDSCQSTCAAFPADAPPGATTGDSLQCRLTYLIAASRTNKIGFCANAGATGGVACGP